MKKGLSVFLCLCMLLGLVACGGTSAEGAPETTALKENGFRVGYAKANITPDEKVDLWGYAQPSGQRVNDDVLDFLYLTCVAVTDEEDNTVLFYGADLGHMEAVVAQKLRAAVAKATGIPASHMFFNATHTHSAPDCAAIVPVLEQAAVKTAQEALADRKAAEMYFGTANTDRISFVRHYYEPNGAVVTDNHGNTAATEFAGHTTQVDEEMRVLQFQRQGGADVLLINWQCHPHMTGGPQKYSISADIVGAMRTSLEQDAYLVAYYQGGAGNLNPTSRIKTEEINTEHDYKVSGQHLANAAKMAMQNMTQLKTGQIQVTSDMIHYDCNKEGLEKVTEARLVVDYFKEGHTAGETKPYAESLGLYSYYHAHNLINRGSNPAQFDLEISAITMGEFAWCAMPGEFFDATAKYIRDNSPYAYNFTAAYTNGYVGYFPTQEAWEYGCYEADTSNVARGAAETVAERLLEMLNEIHK